MTDSDSLFPDIVPGKSEIEVPNEPSFVAACMADIADHVERCGLRFGNSILTRHDRWGLVWRVDILAEHESGRTTRYICWRPPDMEDGIGGTAYVYAKNEDRIK
jgi:hypothetical protein